MIDRVRRRILVIDDHAALLGLIAKCLQQAGHEVISALSVEGALMQMAEVLPDVIVSDVMMPGMDGYELTERIRTNPRTDLIPIILLTAKDTREDRIRGLRAGVDVYLTKPFETEELVAAIENILSRVRRTHRGVARLSRPATSSTDTVFRPITAPSAVLPAELAGTRDSPPSQGRPSAPFDLTEGEQRVAGLVAHGLSNKEIAASLGISHRTVEMHISHILSKKNLSNRVELALLIARELPTLAQAT